MKVIEEEKKENRGSSSGGVMSYFWKGSEQ
jgi:hypothetical protein